MAFRVLINPIGNNSFPQTILSCDDLLYPSLIMYFGILFLSVISLGLSLLWTVIRVRALILAKSLQQCVAIE